VAHCSRGNDSTTPACSFESRIWTVLGTTATSTQSPPLVPL
jgi:hypothetical protein